MDYHITLNDTFNPRALHAEMDKFTGIAGVSKVFYNGAENEKTLVVIVQPGQEASVESAIKALPVVIQIAPAQPK